jgi:Mg2+/citrate symporter
MNKYKVEFYLNGLRGAKEIYANSSSEAERIVKSELPNATSIDVVNLTSIENHKENERIRQEKEKEKLASMSPNEREEYLRKKRNKEWFNRIFALSIILAIVTTVIGSPFSAIFIVLIILLILFKISSYLYSFYKFVKKIFKNSK